MLFDCLIFQNSNLFNKELYLKMQQTAKDQELKIVEGLEEEEQEEQQVTGKNKAALNEKLINSVKKNEIQEVEKCLKKKADISYEENTKKKWNPLIWACCSGYTSIVKLLLSKGAGQQYLEVKPENRHVAIGSTKQLKPNPLHWACFKNHLDVTEILLKAGLHWEDVDCSGNNSVMLAAAGAATEIFKVFLQYGVTLENKNSRGHTAKDLTTEPQILRLITKHQSTKECHISKQAFKQNEIKYWCWICGSFTSKSCYRMEWVLRDLNATQKQKIDGRCSACWQANRKIKQELQNAIKAYEQKTLKSVIEKYKKEHIQLEIRFLQECFRVAQKLTVQNEIIAYIKSLSKVNDYKIILKSVNNIKKMLKGTCYMIFEEAQPINIDQNVVGLANKQIQRLNAERDLRFQIDNIDTSVATRQGVAKLQEIFEKAKQKGVAEQYLEVAQKIKSKMKKSILAQDLYQQFVDYPLRPDPYPQPLVIDFKSKKPIDPQTKKPTDPVNLLPKKKKGNKKTPGFQIPAWAQNLPDLNDRIKELEELIVSREELGLSVEFCGQAGEVIALMKRESRYRKDINTLQAMVDEKKK